MISQEDWKKIDRLRFLEQQTRLSRFAVPTGLIIICIMYIFKPDPNIPFILVPFAGLSGVAMVVFAYFQRKKYLKELALLKAELGGQV